VPWVKANRPRTADSTLDKLNRLYGSWFAEPLSAITKLRFLEEQEEARLRAALNARDAEMREARESANVWRQERQYELLPSLPHFGDHP
jgi:hypothetical protein